MLNEEPSKKLIVHCTLEEVAEVVFKKMNEKYEPEGMSTKEMSKKTGYSVSRLGEFIGMGCDARIGYNLWDYKKFKLWEFEKLPKILKGSGRGRKKKEEIK